MRRTGLRRAIAGTALVAAAAGVSAAPIAAHVADREAVVPTDREAVIQADREAAVPTDREALVPLDREA